MPEIKKREYFYSTALTLLILTITLGLLLNPLFTGRLIEEIRSPTSCTGYWSSCTNSFADDSSRATALAKGDAKKSGIWRNYNLLIPQSATIENVSLRSDFYASAKNGFLDIKVSNDGGLTYGPGHVIGGNTAEKSFYIDLTLDRNWSSLSLTNLNLVVNATCFKQGGGKNPYCYLDWMPINVSYTPFDFSISISPSEKSVQQGISTSAIITISSLGGISQPVSLSQTGCPQASTCSLFPSSGNPPISSQLSISTSSSTPVGQYLITIIGSGDGKTRSTGFVLNVTANANETQNISSPPITNSTNIINLIVIIGNCSDSDGGINPFSKGITNKGNITRTDFCHGFPILNQVDENFCNATGYMNHIPYTCTSGVCQNGACIPSPGTEKPGCIDTDNGINYNSNGSTYNASQSIIDACFNKKDLLETYCDNEGNVKFTDLYACPSGNCFEGKCVDLYDTCTDTDGGKNYNLSGEAKDIRYFRISDYCKSDFKTLTEAYCNVTGLVNSESYLCPNYCNLGACSDQIPECTDSDGGKNLNVQGTTSSPTLYWKTTDYCNNKTILTEAYCLTDGRPYTEIHSCPNGCMSGACI